MSSKKSFKETILNTLYFTLVFVFAVGLATQALARKVNTFQTMTSPIFFYVDKQKITVPSAVSGNVLETLATSGQHVNKGDLIVRIDTIEYDRKIEVLAEVANDNLSARTEMDVLKSTAKAYNIYAPQGGVIYELSAAEGSHLAVGEGAFTLFSDTDARLMSYVTPTQYSEIQRNSDVNVYSKRLEQVFHVQLEGIGRVTADPMELQLDDANSEIRKYELIFRFVNPEDGAVFIEQESLQLIDSVRDDTILRPMDRVANLWNALILGE